MARKPVERNILSSKKGRQIWPGEGRGDLRIETINCQAKVV